jgi:prepilin-type N-terminal cleavage/methylation domain-containing protein/prepilin-type processing-associated H-X9-DG protein
MLDTGIAQRRGFGSPGWREREGFCRYPGNASFTLIELLVVVAIIAILAALLMPSLKGARETAKSIACVNNLRQIYTAVLQYANDHDDCLPPPIYWFRTLGDLKYVGPSDPTQTCNTTNWGWPASYPRWKTFCCPGEKGTWVACSGVPNKISTAYNADLDNCSYDHNWSMNWYAYYSTSPPRRMSQRPDCPGGAGAAWLYMDCQAYQGVGWYWNYREWNIDANTDQVKYAFRHPGNKANAVFLDGHCGTLQHMSATGQSAWVTIWNDTPQ